nr:hypothetical protein [Tanacetum cinerariifolium]
TVELPDHDGRLENRAGAGGGQHAGVQTLGAHATVGVGVGAGLLPFAAKRCDQYRLRRR